MPIFPISLCHRMLCVILFFLCLTGTVSVSIVHERNESSILWHVDLVQNELGKKIEQRLRRQLPTKMFKAALIISMSQFARKFNVLFVSLYIIAGLISLCATGYTRGKFSWQNIRQI